MGHLVTGPLQHPSGTGLVLDGLGQVEGVSLLGTDGAPPWFKDIPCLAWSMGGTAEVATISKLGWATYCLTAHCRRSID